MSEVGVRVPRVYLADRERNVALVEDVRGGKLEDDMNPAALRRLGVMLREMWGHGSPRLGKVAYCGAADGAAQAAAREAAAREAAAREVAAREVAAGAREAAAGVGPARAAIGKESLGAARAAVGEELARERPAGEEPARERPAGEEIVLRRALRDLGDAAGRVGRIGAVRGRLDERVRELADRVGERRDYRLIHGELGPDHVLLDEQGEPVIIDIEGLMYFDLEWEHVFLRLRFGDRYRYLETQGLDEHRMRFYALAMHLSLVAGPLRLLDGDFPEREGMVEIVRYNTDRVLEGLA